MQFCRCVGRSRGCCGWANRVAGSPYSGATGCRSQQVQRPPWRGLITIPFHRRSNRDHEECDQCRDCANAQRPVRNVKVEVLANGQQNREEQSSTNSNLQRSQYRLEPVTPHVINLHCCRSRLHFAVSERAALRNLSASLEGRRTAYD